MKIKINDHEFCKDGNAFALMGCFRRHALEQGEPKPVVEMILKEAMSGDYDNLLRVLLQHIELVEVDTDTYFDEYE